MITNLFSSTLVEEQYGTCDIREYANGHLILSVCQRALFTEDATCESFTVPPTVDGFNEVKTIINTLQIWLEKNKNKMMQSYQEKEYKFI